MSSFIQSQTREQIIAKLNSEISPLVQFIKENEAVLLNFRKKIKNLERVIQINPLKKEREDLESKLHIREELFISNMLKKKWVDSHEYQEVIEIETFDPVLARKRIGEISPIIDSFPDIGEISDREINIKQAELEGIKEKGKIIERQIQTETKELEEKRDILIKISDEKFDINGFNQYGYHRNGTRYSDEGFDCNRTYRDGTNYNDEGYDYAGYNRRGFDRNGKHHNGTKYDYEGFDRNRTHRNRTKYDDEGYDYAGYDMRGFDRNRIYSNGTEYDDEGYDNTGYDVLGFDRNRIHRNGTKYNYEGYDYDGFYNYRIKKVSVGTNDDEGYVLGFDRNEKHHNGTKYDDEGYDCDGFSNYRNSIKKVSVGTKVFHKKYGSGNVLKILNGYIYIDFSNTEKQFVYPNAFTDGYLFLNKKSE